MLFRSKVIVGEVIYWNITNTLNSLDVTVGYGKAVTLSGDGLTLAIGAPNSDSNNGRVYIMKRASRNTNTWVDVVTIAELMGGERFGSAVSLSTDGGYLAVGAPFYNGIGGVEVWRTTDGTNWNRVSYANSLGATNGWLQTPMESYGSAGQGRIVALSGDAQVLVVGEPEHSAYPDGGYGEGAVWVYYNQGDWWQLASQAKLMPTKSSIPVLGFGVSLSISTDGSV